MTTAALPVFCFDDVEVDVRNAVVSKAGAPLPLEPKTFRLLLFLIENRDRLVEKNELLDIVWRDVNVSENALTQAIARLRKTLGDDPKSARYIQTVHTRGYRFIAAVEDARNADHKTAVAELPTAAPTEIAVRPVAWPSRRMQWLLAALAVMVLVAAVVTLRRPAPPRPLESGPSWSLAVLPFVPAHPGVEDSLGVELADAFVRNLRITHLRVTPVTAALKSSERDSDPVSVGRKLGVEYVLYGSVDQPRNRVHAELLRVRDNNRLWQDAFDEKLSDIFQVQQVLSARVLHTLLVTLDHEEHVPNHFTNNQQAYETFLKAHYFMTHANRADYERSIAYFQQAVQFDPRFAMAYAGLADVYNRLGRVGVAPAEYVPKSRTAALKALELDDSVSYAHSMLGMVAFFYDWDFGRAQREYLRGRAIDPALLHQWYCWYLMAVNRLPEAESELNRFAEFLPFAPGLRVDEFRYLTRQYDRALDAAHRKLERDPGDSAAHNVVGEVYEQQGRFSEARVEFNNAIALSGGSLGLPSLGHLAAVEGKRNEAQSILRQLDERALHEYVSPYSRALIYAGLGDKDHALSALEQSYDERSLQPHFLRFDPRLDPLRNDPRFRDFVRTTGLPQ